LIAVVSGYIDPGLAIRRGGADFSRASETQRPVKTDFGNFAWLSAYDGQTPAIRGFLSAEGQNLMKKHRVSCGFSRVLSLDVVEVLSLIY
jgi:hypothetical protein